MAKRRLSALFLAAAAALTLFSGCGSSADAPENGSDSVDSSSPGQAITEKKAADSIFSVNYDPEKSLNPIRADSSTNMQFWSLMYDEIFTVHSDYTFTSDVITAYTTEDNVWWVFNVDTTIPFTDGTTLTAHDIVYSIRQAQQREYYSQRLSVIYGVSAMGDDTFAITTKYADSSLPALLNIPIIKSGSISEDVPAGTGPYRLSEEGDRLVVFEQNRKAGGLPVDTIYLKSYMDTAEKIAAFEDAYIDIVTNDPTGMYNLGYGSSNETRYYDTTNMHFLGFNFTGTFFQTAAARYAINYIIDRSEIVDNYLSGCAVETVLPILPSNELYDQSYASKFSYDPERCLSLLTSNAGVSDYDEDGELEFRVTGIVVETNIDFIVNSDSTAKVRAARRIAEDLNSIGINTTLRELSWNDYVTALQEGDFDMYYGEIRLTADWNLSYLFEEKGSMNYANCSDTSYTDLYLAFLAASGGERKQAFDDASRYLVENAGIIPICFERRQLLTHRGVVSGVSPTQYDIFSGIENWTIDLT